MRREICIFGYGAQGAVWARCLRESGFRVEVFLGKRGESFERARKDGFYPRLYQEFPKDAYDPESDPEWVAFLCPDQKIGSIYRECFENSQKQLNFVLAHGWAVYSGDFDSLRSHHRVTLLAPKAIGPKLEAAFQRSRPHALRAAICAPQSIREDLIKIARALGFMEESLIEADFDQETIGDLISEQGLLCGGLFTLLQWTSEAMLQAGIPKELIREECLTELELLAQMLKENGLAGTFSKISSAAQAGAIDMKKSLDQGARAAFDERISKILDRSFVERFRSGSWEPGALRMIEDFQSIDHSLEEKQS